MWSASRFALLLLGIVACSPQDSRIPSRDGALVIDVRYPRTGTAVPQNDSVSLWGTVGTGRATLEVNDVRVRVERNGTFATFLPVPSGRTPALRLAARSGGRVVKDSIILVRDSAEPNAPVSDARATGEGEVRPSNRWVTMRRLPSDTADSATQWRPIYTRWRPGGEVAIAIAQGIRVLSDARTNRSLRLRLAPDEHVWIPAVDGDTTAPPRRDVIEAGRPAIRSASGEFIISIPLPERLPTSVELSGDRLLWTIFGARWTARLAPFNGTGGTVRRVVPRDSAPGRLVLDLGLQSMPLGWRTEWANGALQLRVRSVPAPTRSLKGLQVTLDPGHPPDGTTGPSGLMEDSVTLEVAKASARLLRSLGATVHLTRTTRDPLSLEARAVIAEQSPAQLFVSLHLNAPGAGRPPEAVNGTQTYWTNPNGRTLARLLLAEVASAMGHPAIGVYQGDFAVLRPTWAAAALVEGSGIVVPEREAFLRTPAGVAAYAQGIVNGIVRWERMSAARALPSTRQR